MWLETINEVSKDRMSLLGLIAISALALLAILAPFVTSYDPNEINISERLQWPCEEHPMGTDKFGRDVFARMIYGARLSLLMPAIAVLVTLTIGVIVGTTSGFFGGKVDNVLMRIVDVLSTFPSLLLTLAILGMLGPGLFNATIAMSVAGWGGYARIIRGMTLSVKEKEFVEAAKSLGAPSHYVMIRHILPNVMSIVIVLATLDMASNILAFSGLSFLGLGAQPPTAEWGTMLSESQPLIFTSPYLMTFPGIFIMITVLAFNLVGDGIRDALDPRIRGGITGDGDW